MPWLRHQDADVLKSTWWRSAPTQQSRCPRSCEYAWVESQLHWMGGQGFLKRKWKTPGQKTGQGQRTYIWEVPNITFKYLQHHWIPVKVQEQHGKSNISVDHFWTEYPRVPRAISLLENRWTHLVKKTNQPWLLLLVGLEPPLSTTQIRQQDRWYICIFLVYHGVIVFWCLGMGQSLSTSDFDEFRPRWHFETTQTLRHNWMNSDMIHKIYKKRPAVVSWFKNPLQ